MSFRSPAVHSSGATSCSRFSGEARPPETTRSPENGQPRFTPSLLHASWNCIRAVPRRLLTVLMERR